MLFWVAITLMFFGLLAGDLLISRDPLENPDDFI